MLTFSPATFAIPLPDNPNANSYLGAVDAAHVEGSFVVFRAPLPDDSRSPATKFRWKQARVTALEPAATLQPKPCVWALDDVSLQIGSGGQPAVVRSPIRRDPPS